VPNPKPIILGSGLNTDKMFVVNSGIVLAIAIIIPPIVSEN